MNFCKCAMWVKKSGKCAKAKDQKACFKKAVAGCMKFRNSKCFRKGRKACKAKKGGKPCMKAVVGTCMKKWIVAGACKKHTAKKCGKDKMCSMKEMKGCFK